MLQSSISIPLNTGDTISGILDLPENQTSGVSLGIAIAHGAANDMHTSLIQSVAKGLCSQGFACLRFNFPYREKQKKSVDPEHRLIHAWTQAAETLKKKTRCKTFIAAGKSLGAWTAAQASASGHITPDGLIFLGYPLNKPNRNRPSWDAPLYTIDCPMLFFEGTQDPFCDLVLMKKVFQGISAPRELVVIKNGDHSFNLPESDPRQPDQIHDIIISRSTDWIRQSDLSL